MNVVSRISFGFVYIQLFPSLFSSFFDKYNCQITFIFVSSWTLFVCSIRFLLPLCQSMLSFLWNFFSLLIFIDVVNVYIFSLHAQLKRCIDDFFPLFISVQTYIVQSCVVFLFVCDYCWFSVLLSQLKWSILTKSLICVEISGKINHFDHVNDRKKG